MGDRLRAGILSRAVTSQLGQLSLASLRGRLIEYQLRLGYRRECHLCRVAGNTVAYGTWVPVAVRLLANCYTRFTFTFTSLCEYKAQPHRGYLTQRFSNFFDHGPLFSSGIVGGPPHLLQYYCKILKFLSTLLFLQTNQHHQLYTNYYGLNGRQIMLVWWMCLLRFAQTVNSWRNVG